MKKTRVIIGAALALALVGCRNNQNRQSAVGDTTGTTAGTTEAEPRSGTQDTTGTTMEPQAGMDAYVVDRIEAENVILVPAPVGGEIEPQAGQEVKLSKDEFQNMAGFEAKEGERVKLQLGADGKPSKIEKQSGQEEPQQQEPMEMHEDRQPGTMQ